MAFLLSAPVPFPPPAGAALNAANAANGGVGAAGGTLIRA